ncbi:uncharacterized protein L3040_003843 [Drepanopeziza brunnea f. sp. 'multigermtubi']|uniref:uncharacterized protein n=1 Tax=Drepanopeziza brunnea f. sp. 'multigermtubi' TaxID=698441 RepID=UPI0023A0452B|nr:hypothetical protein L3040_003843 [Drepanopeziza brunnea f. sp. 'multigermtubi']
MLPKLSIESGTLSPQNFAMRGKRSSLEAKASPAPKRGTKRAAAAPSSPPPAKRGRGRPKKIQKTLEETMGGAEDTGMDEEVEDDTKEIEKQIAGRPKMKGRARAKKAVATRESIGGDDSVMEDRPELASVDEIQDLPKQTGRSRAKAKTIDKNNDSSAKDVVPESPKTRGRGRAKKEKKIDENDDSVMDNGANEEAVDEAEDEAPEPPKRGRGRAKKEKTVNKKEKSVIEDSADEEAVDGDVEEVPEPPKTRGRGRAKKEKKIDENDDSVMDNGANEEAVDEAEDEAPEPPKKRGKGRAKAQKMEENEKSVMTNEAEDDAADVKEVEIAPKKRRGRPKKSQKTSDDTNAVEDSVVDNGVDDAKENGKEVAEPALKKKATRGRAKKVKPNDETNEDSIMENGVEDDKAIAEQIEKDTASSPPVKKARGRPKKNQKTNGNAEDSVIENEVEDGADVSRQLGDENASSHPSKMSTPAAKKGRGRVKQARGASEVSNSDAENKEAQDGKELSYHIDDQTDDAPVDAQADGNINPRSIADSTEAMDTEGSLEITKQNKDVSEQQSANEEKVDDAEHGPAAGHTFGDEGASKVAPDESSPDGQKNENHDAETPKDEQIVDNEEMKEARGLPEGPEINEFNDDSADVEMVDDHEDRNEELLLKHESVEADEKHINGLDSDVEMEPAQGLDIEDDDEIAKQINESSAPNTIACKQEDDEGESTKVKDIEDDEEISKQINGGSYELMTDGIEGEKRASDEVNADTSDVMKSTIQEQQAATEEIKNNAESVIAEEKHEAGMPAFSGDLKHDFETKTTEHLDGPEASSTHGSTQEGSDKREVAIPSSSNDLRKESEIKTAEQIDEPEASDTYGSKEEGGDKGESAIPSFSNDLTNNSEKKIAEQIDQPEASTTHGSAQEGSDKHEFAITSSSNDLKNDSENKTAEQINGPEASNTNGSKQEGSEKREAAIPSSILEKGIIYFFFRARVGVEDPNGIEDVARSYIVLRPLPLGAKLGEGPLEDSGNARLLALPKKMLPKSRQDRFLVFVEQPNATIKDLREQFSSNDYATQTSGTSHIPAATPFAEGIYAITSTGRESHLAYHVTMPAIGEIQKELGLNEKGSYVVSAKNPNAPGPANATLDNPAQYPEHIQSKFRNLRWMPLEPELLNYQHTQFLIIGEGLGDMDKAVEEMSRDERDDETETPGEEMAKLEEEDHRRVQHLEQDDPIFADLGLSSKEYPKMQTTW